MVLNFDAKKMLALVVLMCALPAVAIGEVKVTFNNNSVVIDGQTFGENELAKMQESAKANELFAQTRRELDTKFNNEQTRKLKELDDKLVTAYDYEVKVKQAQSSTKKWTRGTDIFVGALIVCAYDQFFGGQYVKKTAFAGYTLAQATWKQSKKLHKNILRTWRIWFPKKDASLKNEQKEAYTSKQQEVPQQHIIVCNPVQQPVSNEKIGCGGTDVR